MRKRKDGLKLGEIRHMRGRYMGREGKQSREPSRIAKLEVEALPTIGALPWYPSMAGPAVNGTQTQVMVMITSHACRNEIGPWPSQEVDPMG